METLEKPFGTKLEPLAERKKLKKSKRLKWKENMPLTLQVLISHIQLYVKKIPLPKKPILLLQAEFEATLDFS